MKPIGTQLFEGVEKVVIAYLSEIGKVTGNPKIKEEVDKYAHVAISVFKEKKNMFVTSTRKDIDGLDSDTKTRLQGLLGYVNVLHSQGLYAAHNGNNSVSDAVQRADYDLGKRLSELEESNRSLQERLTTAEAHRYEEGENGVIDVNGQTYAPISLLSTHESGNGESGKSSMIYSSSVKATEKQSVSIGTIFEIKVIDLENQVTRLEKALITENRRTSESEEKNRVLIEQNGRLKEESVSLEERLGSVEDQLAGTSMIVANQGEYIIKMEAAIEMARQLMKEKIDLLSRAYDENAKKDIMINKLNGEIAEYVKTISKITADLDDFKARYLRTKDAHIELQANYDSMNNQFKAYEQEMGILRPQLKTEKERVFLLTGEKESSEGRLISLRKENEGLKEENLRKDENLSRLYKDSDHWRNMYMSSEERRNAELKKIKDVIERARKLEGRVTQIIEYKASETMLLTEST